MVAIAAAVSLAGGGFSPLAAQVPAGFEFGDDSGNFPQDSECDDLRFEGEGMAQVLLTDEIGRDASDCRDAFESGTVALNPLFLRPESVSAIIFGDDTSDFSGDGRCDDVRFASADSDQMIYLAEDIGRDATDCQSEFEAGNLEW